MIFYSGFRVSSPIQLNFSFLCPKCKSIVPCSPIRFLEKEGNGFVRALKQEAMFSLYPPKSMALSGVFGKEFKLNKEIIVPFNVLIVSDGAIIRAEVNSNETS